MTASPDTMEMILLKCCASVVAMLLWSAAAWAGPPASPAIDTALWQAAEPPSDPSPPPTDGQGWIGVRIQQVTDLIGEAVGLSPARGALVVETQPGPARAAGLVPADVILRVDGADIVAVGDVPTAVKRVQVGQAIEVVVWRRGAQVALTVTVGSLDEARGAAAAPPPAPAEPVHLFGLTLEPLGTEARQRFHIDERIGGAAVTAVETDSQGAKNKMVAGDVVDRVGDVATATPAEVAAEVDARRREGRRAVLMRVMTAKGEARFVAMSLGVGGD